MSRRRAANLRSLGESRLFTSIVRDGWTLLNSLQTTPHARTHNLSQHVHRIGYHFPSTVVAAACLGLGLYLTSTGKAVPFHTLGTVEDHATADSEVNQEVINTEARDAIKDLFPNIPDNDLFQIIKTAFQKVCLQCIPVASRD